MSSEFFFSLARVCCAQILRSHGIERCAPSLLDAITDIMIRHLTLLSGTATRNANLSGRNETEVPDVALAMEQTGVVKPFSTLDASYDNESAEDEFGLEDDLAPQLLPDISGFDEFIQWAQGPAVAEAARVARIPLTSTAAATAAAQNTASATAKSTSENTSATTMAAAKFQPTANPADQQWLTALMRKQTGLVGHEHRFTGTVLGDDQVDSDLRALDTR